MSKVGEYFREKEEMDYFGGDAKNNRDIQSQLVAEGKLCDGECGNVYFKQDLNRTCYGDDLCNRCMMQFAAEQSYE